MSDTDLRKTADELDEALRLLDHELAGLKLEEPLQVRAIGGYALLKHGVRKGDRAFTMDIDTVTRDYGMAVERAVRKVAEQLDLEPNWLNNDNVLDNDTEHIEELFKAEWLPQAMGLRNIAVSIASIETLTRAKISATDDSEFNGRDQDAADLKDLIEFQGITTQTQFQKLYPDPFGEFPEAARVVRAHFSPNAATKPSPRGHLSRFPELNDFDLDSFGSEDLDHDLADDVGMYR